MKKKMKLEEILAKNLTRLMGTVPGLDTIEKVALRSGVGRGTVDRVRKAEVSTKIETVEALASAFSVSALDLLTDQNGAGQDQTNTNANAGKHEPGPAKMQWVTDEEAGLLSDFRATDDEGRDTMKKIGSIVPKILALSIAHNQPQ